MTIQSWENSGLRHRVEGRDLGGIDVVELQLTVVERAVQEPGRRRRRRVALTTPGPDQWRPSPSITLADDRRRPSIIRSTSPSVDM